MLKSLKGKLVANKDLFRIPKSIQDVIPFDTIYEDGIFQQKNMYSKCYEFTDNNYIFESRDERQRILEEYMEFINSFDPSIEIKETIYNRVEDIESFKRDYLIPEGNDEYKVIRDCFNHNILNQYQQNNNIQQVKYITFTVNRRNYNEAAILFNRLTNDITIRLHRIGVEVYELNAIERLEIISSFYHDDLKLLELSFDELKNHFKDYITPDTIQFHKDYFSMNGKVARVLYISEYPTGLAEDFVSEITSIHKKFLFSKDYFLLPVDEARSFVLSKHDSIEKNIHDFQQRLNNSNSFSNTIPIAMEQKKEDIKQIFNDITTRNQRVLLANIVLLHVADTLEELNKDSAQFISIASGYGCILDKVQLPFRQYLGLNTALPIFNNLLGNYRLLLSQGVAAFVPFRVKDLMQKGGIYLGQHLYSNHPIFMNKANLKNCNGFVLGVPGSGKSFIVKEEIEEVIARTNDHVIICDPEGEYDNIIKVVHGQIVNITAKGKDHINALDMTSGYGESIDPVAEKAQFVMSLFEQLDNGRTVLTAKERSIIDQCVYEVYDLARSENRVPTLADLQDALYDKNLEEADDLAIRLEICVHGSFDTFGHETNVDFNNRIISFNIRHLLDQQKGVGVLVITDAIINKVNENWQKGIRTHVFIDEIHVLFSNPDAASFFSSAWRQFRKRGAYPTGITQNVSYLLQSEQGTSLISNSEFLILLQQATHDIDQLSRLINLSEEQRGQVKNVPAGQGIIKYGGTLIPFKNEMEKNAIYYLNSTKPEDKEKAPYYFKELLEDEWSKS